MPASQDAGGSACDGSLSIPGSGTWARENLQAKQFTVAHPGPPALAALKEGVLVALPCDGGGSAQAVGKWVPGQQAQRSGGSG